MDQETGPETLQGRVDLLNQDAQSHLFLIGKLFHLWEAMLSKNSGRND